MSSACLVITPPPLAGFPALYLLVQQGGFERLGGNARAYAGALFLKRHGDAGIALPPTTAQAFGQLLESRLGELHRHTGLARERHGEAHILVREAQRERRRIVDAGQEELGETVEGALAA